MEKGPAKRSAGLRTISKIVEFAAKELDEVGAVQFNLDRVIEKSGVSRGSVYHHFGDRDGLIVAVEVSEIVQILTSGNEQMRRLFSESSSGEEIVAGFGAAIQAGTGDTGRNYRRRRVASLATAQHSPAIARALVDLQLQETDYWAATLRIGAERGLIRPIEPLLGTADVIQSLLVGRILVDILEDDTRDVLWIASAVEVFRALLRPQ
ncbi:MAG: helix-turn-helix domain-containing protein [Actinomycetes bacterium]|jgi:AcrR family transcriptional regulator